MAIPVVWRRIGPAGRMACACAAVVLVVGAGRSGLAARDEQQQSRRRFSEDAAVVQRATELICSQAAGMAFCRQPLHAYYQAEFLRGRFDAIAVVAGGRIEAAHRSEWHDLAWETMLPGLAEPAAEGASASPQAEPRENGGHLELALALSIPGREHGAPRLMLVRKAGLAAGWTAFAHDLHDSAWLALGSGLCAYLLCLVRIQAPLRRLVQHLQEHGLDGLKADRSTPWGDLRDLFDALSAKAAELLDVQERHAQRSSRVRTGDDDAQAGWFVDLARELRRTMSAVLGHAELLATTDLKPADRINHIRAVQHDVRQIIRFAQELQDLAASGGTPRRASLPWARLRQLLRQLQDSARSTLLSAQPGSPESAAERRASGVASGPPLRLGGSVLVVGRRDALVDGLLRDLQGLGLDALWVREVDSAAAELAAGRYEVVVLNLLRADAGFADRVAALRRQLPDLPLVALSSRAAAAALQPPFADVLYPPVDRRGILRTLGKFLGFRPEESREPGA